MHHCMMSTNLYSPWPKAQTATHTDKGGEFKSRDLESFCAWRGIVHTFVDMNSGHGANDEWAPVRDARDPQQCRMPMLSLCKEIDSW